MISCMLSVLTNGLYAQERRITGTVSADGDPLIGASVKVQDMNIGVLTDQDGAFELSVPEEAEAIEVSYLGYISKTIRLGDDDTYNIILETENVETEEVVITALGIKKEKKAVGFAIQQVQGDELTQARETNFINSLAGKVAGVNITGSSSGITASSNINIRGQSSLSGTNQPLFIVNGMPITNGLDSPGDGLNGSSTIDFGNAASVLNSYDIESINVLKGPTAAALYGTRASNGVILVTTKTGENTSGWGISLNSNTMFSSLLRQPNWQNEFGGGNLGKRDWIAGNEYSGNTYEAFGESWGPPMDGRLIRQFGSDGEPVPFTPAPDNYKNFYETGYALTHNIALSKSSEDFHFRLSYTNLYQEGIVPNTDLTRNTFYMAGGANIADKITVDGQLTYIDSDSDNVPNAGYDESSSIMYGWLWYPRHLEISKLEDYWLPRQADRAQRNHENLWTNNPYFLVNENTNSFQGRRLIGTISVNYQLNDHLGIRFRSGGDVRDQSRQFRRAWSTRTLPFGSYREDELSFLENNNELFITYQSETSENLGENDLTVEVSVGGNRMWQESQILRSNTGVDGLTIPGVYNLANARGNILVDDFTQEKQINSVFGVARFAYRGYAFLDVTGRNDWSSTLPADNNSYFYPSASLSLVLSDMFGFSGGALSFAKLRMGYANVGGDTDPYNVFNNFLFGNSWGSQAVAQEDPDLANRDLKPESINTYEIGADLRFFKGRIQLDATYYDIRSKDQILNVPIAQTSGYRSRLLNAGEIRNRGFEAVLKAAILPRSREGLNWDVVLNFSRNRSEVVELAEGIENYQIVSSMYPGDFDTQGLSFEARVGEPVGQLVGLGFQRVESGPFEGQIIHENGLPQETTTRVSAGTYQPDFIAGIYNTLTWKNFSLGFLFDGRFGGKIFSRLHTMLNAGGTITNEDDDRLPNATIGRITQEPLPYDENNQPATDEDGNYLWEQATGPGFIGPGVKNMGTAENPEYVPNDVPVDTRAYYLKYYGSDFRRHNIESGTFDATYVKLREVKLTYQLPNELLDRIGFQSARISLVGRNLLLFTNVPTIDPEAFAIRNGRIIPGFEDNNLPSVRSYGIDLSLGL